MKNLKLLFIATLIVFSSCSSSDDDEVDTTPITQEAKATLDLNALASMSGNDATSLIQFNGTPAGQFTSEALIGDKILYKINTNDATTIVRFTNYSYSSGSEELWGEIDFVNDGNWLAGLEIQDGATNDDEVKFDIEFQLEVNGVLQTNKTYIIDPKIKIRSRRRRR